ncbi:hypothetical protein FISHEDRAFT_57971 [Fistulina hepatica ATCC 64428]|uniref:Uncharacterized protein n=1 Tax=Fistulina hepatica ATCC 64428 TaxID=1128425 RepID=A0A0D7AE58_9AGAR|nr:hypothetical protein FISHEDRAFT_57971 [Fistulina hepatica ATCC 64428]
MSALSGDLGLAGTAPLKQQHDRDPIDTAKSYLPDPQQVRQSLESAGDTVKQYLPASVAFYILPGTSSDTSLPSREGNNQTLGETDGVGSLPGSPSETGVAKLSTARTSLPSQERAGEVLGKTDGAGPLPGSPSETSVAKLPAERLSSSSQERADQVLGRTHGVGPLPSPASEMGVVKLPDERASRVTSKSPPKPSSSAEGKYDRAFGFTDC